MLLFFQFFIDASGWLVPKTDIIDIMKELKIVSFNVAFKFLNSGTDEETVTNHFQNSVS